MLRILLLLFIANSIFAQIPKDIRFAPAFWATAEMKSPMYKIGTTDTAATKKAVRDSSAALRALSLNSVSFPWIYSGTYENDLITIGTLPDGYSGTNIGNNFGNCAYIDINYRNGLVINTNYGEGVQIYTNNKSGYICQNATNFATSIKSVSKTGNDSIVITGNNEIRQYRNGIIVSKLDSLGFFRSTMPHIYASFFDSTISVPLTQNVWQQVNNPSGRSSFAVQDSSYIGYDHDTLICKTSIHGFVKFRVNVVGSNTKVYEYRIRRKNGTISTIYSERVDGTGTTVVRNPEAYFEGEYGTRLWLEVRSTTAAPGTITLIGGTMAIDCTHISLN